VHRLQDDAGRQCWFTTVCDMQRALAAAEERLKDGISNLASLEEERHAAKSKEEALQVSTAVPLHMTRCLSMLAESTHRSCC